MESNKVELYSQSGKSFFMEGCCGQDASNIGVLTPGYIITKDGKFVSVGKNNGHDDVFSQYLMHYFDGQDKYYGSTAAASVLSELDHVVYFGIRESDVGYSYANSQNGILDGKEYGVIVLPKSMQLSQEQKRALKLLVSTNRRSYPGARPKLDLTYGEIISGLTLEESDFNNLINSNQEDIHRMV